MWGDAKAKLKSLMLVCYSTYIPYRSSQAFNSNYLIPTSMSFGFSIGDFRAATELATNTLGLLTAENEANQNSVIILSFRSLQAQRIKELQQKLHQISLVRVRALGLAAPESDAGRSREDELRAINRDLDDLLSGYG